MGDPSGKKPFSLISYLSYWYKLLLSLFLLSLPRLRTFSGSIHPLNIWGASTADQTRATRSLVLTDIVEWTSTSPYRGQHREFKVKCRREQSNSEKGRESYRSSPGGGYSQPIKCFNQGPAARQLAELIKLLNPVNRRWGGNQSTTSQVLLPLSMFCKSTSMCLIL